MELNCRFVAHQDDGGVAFEQEFHQRPHDYSNLLISGHYFIIKITFNFKLILFYNLSIQQSCQAMNLKSQRPEVHRK